VTQFRNLADGDIFQLGLNNYQILYRDPAYAGTAITLTTAVPEPATLVGLVVASPLAFLVARRRRRAGGDANKKSDNA
jgi:ABC-type spermidine/putrescine transport system permease subunit I